MLPPQKYFTAPTPGSICLCFLSESAVVPNPEILEVKHRQYPEYRTPKHSEYRTPKYCEYSQNERLKYCQTRSTSSIFPREYVPLLPTINTRYWVLGASVQVLEVFRGLVLLILLSTRSIKILLICTVYSECQLCFDRLCTPSTISSRFWAENCDRRSHECSLEQITFVGSNWSTSSTGSISGVYTASTRQYFGVLYCGYSILQVFRGSILRIRRYSQYSYCSYSQYSQYSGLQYCSYSEYSQYELYSILRVYSKYEVYWEHLCSIVPHRQLAFSTAPDT